MTTSSYNSPEQPGLQVVFGSRTRRGLTHANEDRHAIASWTDWNPDSHMANPEDQQQETTTQSYPIPRVVAPLCTGSARKDTTVHGVGATGGVVNPLSFSSGGDSPGSGDSRNAAFLWTVCDGHDGPEAADYVCEHVGASFSRIWHTGPHKIPPTLLKDKKYANPEEANTYVRGYALSNALARTFEALDSSFKQHVTSPELGPDGQSKGMTCTAGSCVTSIFLTGNLMCCAGLGDCKAAILTLEEADGKPSSADASTTGEETTKATQQFQVTWFSKEHRSSAPKERARIRMRGGWFRHGRVGGVLEPTRTIGDFDVKASQPVGVVIATPEVRTFSVTKPALVLVASDGVWDVMDASQLLRTLKKRRRLWRGILSWLGAPLPEKKGLSLTFGFRRRAKSKEGFESMFQMPTGGDLCAMADNLVTRAHDLGSDDDCTCVAIFLKPADAPDRPPRVSSDNMPEDLQTAVPETAAPEDDDEEEDDEDEDEEDEGDEEEEEPQFDASADSAFEYEKWRNPKDAANADQDNEDEEGGVDGGPAPTKDTDAWDLSTATFPVSLVPTNQGFEARFSSGIADSVDAPEVIEKARRRREERRAARERRKKSLASTQR